MQIPLGTSYLNPEKTISIPHEIHSYCLGKTRVGKSVYLGNIAEHLIAQGFGLTVIDPHGNLIDRLLKRIPRFRMEHTRHDVVILRVSENSYPGINPFAVKADTDDIVSSIVDSFAKAFEKQWGESSDSVLRWACYAVLEGTDDASFDTVKRFLKNDEFMQKVLTKVTRQDVLDEFSGYDKKEWKSVRAERIAPVLNKLDKFITNKKVRRVVTQTPSLDLKRIQTEKKIFFVDLSGFGRKERVILGGFILNMHLIAAQKRRPETGPHHSILVDEAQTFVTAPYDYILSELGKYRITMHVATQFVAGFPEEVRDGIFGNCSTEVVFRVGGRDAEIMVRELTMEHPPRTLQDLPNRQAYIRTLVSDPALETYRPEGPQRVIMNKPSAPLPDDLQANDVIARSKERFGSSVDAPVDTDVDTVSPHQRGKGHKESAVYRQSEAG